MKVNRKPASAELHLRHDLLALLACYVLLSWLLTFPQATKAQVGQEERGLGIKQKETAQKVALVIGNADYDTSIGKIKNPVNDAADIAAALTRLGFKLVGSKPQLNLNKRQMLELIREFGNQIGKGGVGIFYFAGHGVQIDKRNYLIPISNSLQYQEDAEFEAVDVDQILRQMEYSGNALNIMILDACRNNELPKKTRNTGNGLGEPQRKPSGVYIAFAARDGQIALENPNGRNGLYTQELLKNLETLNLRLEDIFINTRREVKRLSNRMQEPIEYGSIDDVFYFKSNNSITGERPSAVDRWGSPPIASHHSFVQSCDRATVTGSVETNSPEVLVWFEWGETPDLGKVTVKQRLKMTIKQRIVDEAKVYQDLVDLKENTTYFYRLVASDIYGIVRADVSSFTTPRC